MKKLDLQEEGRFMITLGTGIGQAMGKMTTGAAIQAAKKMRNNDPDLILSRLSDIGSEDKAGPIDF